MMRVWLLCVLAVSGLGWSAFSNASDDPWLILQKTAYAARELGYQGVFVYQNGKDIRSVQITHMNKDGLEVARNVILDNSVKSGQAREVFSQGSDIVIFHPRKEKMVIEKRRGQNMFPAMFPTDFQLIKSSYTAKLGTTEFVAGRHAQIVELIPNDALRYSYKIWADTEYGILLKMTLLNTKQETLEQIEFNQLTMMNSQDVNWFQPKIDVTKSYVMEEEPAVQRVTKDWVLDKLPPGYRKIDHVERMMPGKHVPMNQMIFSDGIASVSLFIEPMVKGMRPKMGHKLIGSTNICADVIDGYQIVVVGEVPEATVTQIAKAVRFKKQAEASN
jgi:sigma-E factor negative regulatory protein RseB